jgi:hypothetical protein
MATNPRPSRSVNRHTDVSAPTADFSTRVIDFFQARGRFPESRSATRENEVELWHPPSYSPP